LLGIVAAAVALKNTSDDPAGTVTVAGTVNNGLLLDSDTAVPPMGAASFSTTAHDEIWPPVKLERVQKRIEESAGPNKLSVAALDPPFHVPVTIALWWVGIVIAAVALKFVPNDPAGTVMVAGTVNNELLLDSEIAIPPPGAAIFSLAVHVEIWPPVRLPTVQVSEERRGTATVLPVVLNADSPKPVASTATAFVTLSKVVVALAASVTWMLATTPADIALGFKPVARQVNKPGAEWHDTVLPAAAAAGPVVAPIAEI
jgi:hypothetical protein